MRYSANEYARALYEVIRDKSDSESEQTINKFLSDMKDRGQMALLPEILKEMPDAIKATEGIEDVLIETAYDIDDQTVSAALRALGKNESEVEVTTAKNPELLGGIKVKGRDTVMDASLKGRLNMLREAFARPADSRLGTDANT